MHSFRLIRSECLILRVHQKGLHNTPYICIYIYMCADVWVCECRRHCRHRRRRRRRRREMGRKINKNNRPVE